MRMSSRVPELRTLLRSSQIFLVHLVSYLLLDLLLVLLIYYRLELLLGRLKLLGGLALSRLRLNTFFRHLFVLV